ncbi:serpin family protein [Nocardia sp. NBC_00508]|uniref:serpin family protein n=1 Tax=Nocardia sp. NBC_00508 TaxID=2975992 RepID=UPI002E812C57|nr:serpin family protein [Nocardia sp. NBC_00508]WUD65395.1 serpin family protein [Nocardia sp. NBC_00508]
MRTSLELHVGAANALTARWCAEVSQRDFVVSGAGVWPLLALLASAAEGSARDELAAAIGVPGANGQDAGLRLLRDIEGAEAVSAALGVWVRHDLPLHEEWSGRLPAGVLARLAGQAELDGWAARHTDGLIERFPLSVNPDTLMVLATALVAKTRWRVPFEVGMLAPKDGPWQGHRGPGLSRTSTGLTNAAILDAPQPVTRVIVEGAADLDVHLLLGPSAPGTVLGTGLAALSDAVPIRTGLPVGTEGPGLTVRTEEVPANADQLRLRLPPFEVRSTHDLLAGPGLFGLTAATDCTSGHFPAISPVPLCVGQGAQEVLARFSHDGFEAAAVTAFGLRAASAALRNYQATVMSVTFDRPFGFLAVHRPTGLAVVAGWIATPPTSPPAGSA